MYPKHQEWCVPSVEYRSLRMKEWRSGWTPLFPGHCMVLFLGHFHKSCRKFFSGNVIFFLSQFSSKWPLMAASSVLAIRGALSASFFIWKEALLSGVHFQITQAQYLPRDLWLICGYYDPNVATLAFKGILFPCSLLGRCLSPTTSKLSIQACDPTSSLCLQGSNSSALSKEVFEEGSTPSQHTTGGWRPWEWYTTYK